MADTIKIFGLEIRVGNTPMDLEKVDKLIVKTSQHIVQAKKDWAAYSNVLSSLKGHELILQFMREFEVKTKSTTVARRTMTAEEKVAARQARESAKAEEMQALAEKSRLGSIRQLEAEISKLNILWKNLSKEERTKTASGRAMTAQLTSLRKELRETKVAAGDFSGNIGNYMSGIYNSITTKIAALGTVVYSFKRILTSIFSPFQDLEYRMAMVKAVSRATDEEFVMLKGNARELGASTEYTATEVAGLQLAYARMGFVPNQIRQITGATLDLATATGEDLARSADVVGVTLRGFNLDASQTQRVVDVMTKSFNASSLQLSYFYDAIKYVGPIASEANVSLEETAAMLGILADRGIRGSQAGTALRRIFTEIAKEGGDVSARLAELNKRGLTLGGAMDEVGKYAMTALTVLVKSKDGVDSFAESLNNAGGAAKTAADGIRDTMKIDVAVFLSAVQEKLIAIGDYLSPLGRSIIQTGTWAVTNIKAIASSLVVATGLVLLYNQALKVKIYWTALSTLNDKAKALATALNTASLSGNTAALIRNSVAIQNASVLTKAFAVVKLLLAGNIKAATVAMRSFTVSLASNPLGIFAVALAAVASYFLVFRDKTDAATRAQRKFNDENDRFNKAQDEKRQRIEQLIRAIQAETETEYAKIRAYEELKLLSPDLTAKYSREQLATLELAKSTKILNEQRDKENYNNLVANVEKYSASLKKLKEEHDAIQGANADGSFTAAQGSRRLALERQIEDQKILLTDYKKELKEADEARQQVEENAKPLEVRIKAAEDIVAQAEDAFNKAETAYEQKRDEWVQEHGTERTLPFYFKYDMLQSEKEWHDAQKKLADLQKQGKITATGSGSKKEKGEWSLTKDKEHNRQLLDLKKKLHSGEIASEEQYQKQVLQLEINTLTKRIALNKDEAKTILKLKNELWDKQNQQKKNERKGSETYTVNRKAQAERELKYENDRIDAEIAAMKEGVEKKIRLNDQATKKAQESAAKEYRDELDKLNKEQKTYEAGSARYKEIEAAKLNLAFDHELKLESIKAAGANARTKILQAATKTELQEWGELPDKAAEAERQITENKRREVEKRLKLAREETADSIVRAKNQYDADESVADATLGKKGRKRNVAGVANEVQLHKNFAQVYTKELNGILAEGDDAIEKHKERYNELIRLIGQEQTAAMNLGKGKNANGTRKSFWKQLTELSDEDMAQIKQQALDLAQQLSDAIFNAKQEASQRQLNAEKKAIDAEYKTESKLLDSKRDKGLISEKKYQEELEKLEAKKAEKEEAAERAAFERDKRLNIMQAIMNTAIAVAKAFAQFGPVVGIPFAAMAAAQGAIQIATISAQKYAQGGLIPLSEGVGVVKGRSHAQGGHQIYLDGRPIGEIEGDELLAIVNKRDTARIGALSAANSVHGRRFAQGGLVASGGFMVNHVSAPVSIGQLETAHRAELARRQDEIQSRHDAVIQALAANIEAINNRIDTLKVVVLAQDMTDTQDNIKKIKVKSSF